MAKHDRFLPIVTCLLSTFVKVIVNLCSEQNLTCCSWPNRGWKDQNGY